MPKMAIFLILCLSTGSTHCQVVTHPPTEVFILKIDPQNLFQEIDHFGASDAWSGQFVGNWPEDKKQTITDLLFSKDMDEQGNPIGIGLSLWRMNLGAASAGQGDGSGIRDPWRRAPSFLNEDGHFDREGQKGQFWLAHTAKEKKVEYLLAFLNSPPVWLTRNGKAFVDSGKQSNLASENQAAFADFMVATLMGLKEEGLAVDYISPVNEPQWDWEDGGQEGTPFWNQEIASIVRSLDAKLQESGLSTKIDIAEAGQIEYLYGEHNRPGRANQIREFFEKDSENYIGDLAHLSTAISGHSYFTTSPVHQAFRKRELVANAVQQVPRLKYWMSEYCILGGNEGEISGSGKDLGMTPALYMARVIYHDLVVAQASAWHWWLAISPYDYKDGLVYISKSETDGDMEESKMLWAMGNYSRFIRPGYRRVSATLTDQQMQNKDLLASAYRDPESGNLVIVLVNANNSEAKVSLQVERDGIPEEWAGYLTDKDHDLAFRSILSPEEVLVPASSILTLTTGVP